MTAFLSLNLSIHHSLSAYNGGWESASIFMLDENPIKGPNRSSVITIQKIMLQVPFNYASTCTCYYMCILQILAALPIVPKSICPLF